MISFLLILSACSQRVIIKKEEVAVLPPDNLLIFPCNTSEAGETVRSLAKGYIENKSCVNKYKQSLDSLKRWKVEQEKIYNVNTK